MANEMFTTRSGHQVPVATYVILPEHMVSIMRLKEDFEARGEYLSLHGVILDILDKGIRQIRNQWKNGDLSKNQRNFAKSVAVYMSDPSKYSKEIAALAVRHGLVKGTQVELSAPSAPEPTVEELTVEELEAATSQNSNGQ
jgi:hypothetical protein